MALSTRGKLAVRSAMDIEQGFEPPLDFTFMCLTSVADCLEEQPRDTTPEKSKTQTSQEHKQQEAIKRKTNAIRLSNNVITEWRELSSTVQKLVENPNDIEWIDLSFNDLTSIDKCVLEYPNLKVLYLHGNSIEKITEIDKLNSLLHLKTLTLHGNPIEVSCKGYRQYVLSRLPLLKNIDFSCVTKSDRACGHTWHEMNKQKRKKTD
ncbi:leucine-rich repeat-containing protein 51-like [Hydractinia symbiolongicarpus]|uniref:leucine-rich repeat-containing protein 51-like n=1 Tax=Hydractinia symbiolongicarpus TaxID=13093 RepID=UPI00254B140F|nr:leucine-rich repeat-containing protein 51-like [Hydractinia symbiolongicarpus]